MASEIAELRKRLGSSEVAERRQAAETLAQMGEEAAEAARELVNAAGDADEQVREWAVGALEALGPPAAGLTSGLVEQLANPRADAAYWAATLLGRLGGEAQAASGPLAKLVQQAGAAAVRQRSAWALGKIGEGIAGEVDGGTRAAVQASLSQAAEDGDAQLARQAREALKPWSAAS